MKICITVFWVMSTVWVAAQQPSQQAAQQETTAEEQTDGSEQTDPEDLATGTADTPGAEAAAAEANDNSDQTPSNAPALSPRTASDSGSPAMLAGDNGHARDGTNTMQRASMNMVGSPARNLGLDAVSATEPDSEMGDRQNYEQAKRASARDQERRSGREASGGQSDQINEKSRRENNELSDQNLSSKNRNAEEDGDKEERRPRRKRN